MNDALSGESPVDPKVGRYPLIVENVGEDTYVLMSKGHHDPHAFMRTVRADYSWPLGFPTHEWMRAVPAPRNSGYRCLYVEAKPGSRGAFPCTYTREAYNADTYEALVAGQKPTKTLRERACGGTPKTARELG